MTDNMLGRNVVVAVVGIAAGYLAYRLYFQAEEQSAPAAPGSSSKKKKKKKKNSSVVKAASTPGGGDGDGEKSTNPLDNVVIRPASDTRLYRIITLKNGLRACLISDPSVGEDDDDDDDEEEDAGGDEPSVATTTAVSEDADADGSGEEQGEDFGDEEEEEEEDETSQKPAAAAFCMGAGSFEDTAELQGMAHFVEHMLFMGSERYPKEDQFDKFVAKHGGYSNAHTDMEETCFVFDVKRKYLRRTLDMFAQFFVAPLIQEGSMDREVEAVDSEFTMNEQHDAVRKSQVFATLAVQGHPASRFTWGNTVSLKEIPESTKSPVREQLHQFWKKHYSP